MLLSYITWRTRECCCCEPTRSRAVLDRVAARGKKGSAREPGPLGRVGEARADTV